MKYLLGIDLGTSSTKVLLMSIEGSIIDISQEGYDVSIPKSGWAEQSPQMWWEATVRVIKSVLNKSKINPRNIVGIGFSGQMHGLVALDERHNVIRPSIIWADQRTQKQIDDIYKTIGKKEIVKTTLNELSTGFFITSLLWIKENEPENYKKINKVVLPKDYIRYKLVGNIGTDTTDASSTLIFNTVKREWAYSIIKDLGINKEIFPMVYESHMIAGQIQNDVALLTGLQAGTPVVYGAGDQPMQSLGNGIIKPGIISSNIGTASQIATPINNPLYDSLTRTNTFCNIKDDLWTIMGASLNGGIALKWLRDNILQKEGYDELNNMALQIEAGSDGLLFLPYLSGERTPHNDPNARGMFWGLTLGHNNKHLVRSVMEGVIYSLKGSIGIFEMLGIKMDKVIASGGGAKSQLWLQMQADIFNKEIYTTNSIEQACLGAAIIAGVGVGIYETPEEASDQIITLNDIVTEPIRKNVEIYKSYYEVFQELYIKNQELFIKIEGVNK